MLAKNSERALYLASLGNRQNPSKVISDIGTVIPKSLSPEFTFMLISCPECWEVKMCMIENCIGNLNDESCKKGGKGGGQWRKMANNGEKWRIMAMANSAFSFVKFAIFRQFLILEFHI